MSHFRMRQPLVAIGAVASAVAVSALPMPAMGQQVADHNLSDIRVDNVGGCATLTVNFNIRVQILSHFPETSGRELRIQLQSLDGLSLGKESLRAPETVPELRSVEFESDNPAGPVLSLYFTRDMHFDVQAGDRPQAVVIKLSGTCEAGAGATSGASVVRRAQALPQIAVPSGLYVLNLESQPTPIGVLPADQARVLAGRIVYENDFERDSQHWHRLRLGFFDTREAADAEKARLAGLFPDAWTLRVGADERAAGVANRMDTGAPLAAPAPAVAQGSAADTAETASLTANAEAAIKAGDNDRAIQILTNAMARPDNSNTPRALELLGLTHERKGQMAHAQAEYEDYLRRFPAGEGADRVRQRLAALTGGAPGQSLHAGAASGRSAGWVWGARGSFSQFYFRDQSNLTTLDATAPKPNTDTPLLNLNQLLTAADVTVTGGNDRRQVQMRAAGSFAKDFGTSGNSHDIKSLTALYLDYADRDAGVSARFGRQTRNSDGVLGRFDGGLVSWQARPKLRLNVVGGFPVLNSHQMSVLDTRPFYGVSLDVGGRRSPLQSTVYWFDQRSAGGFVDRRSVGIEERFLKRNFNAYLLLDYDVKYSALNLGLLTLNYAFPDHSNFSLTADYRRSPLLTTNNALIGLLDNANQPILDLRGMRPFFTDPQIYDAAKGNTLITKSITATYSRPITGKLQVNMDFTATDTGGTAGIPATTGTQAVLAMPATGKEYYYGAQLVGSGLFWQNDIYILSGRYADSYGGRTWTVDFNARVPVTSKFRLSPRLRYGRRTYTINPGNYHQFQPTLQMNWYPFRHGEVEIEAGGNFTSQTQTMGGSTVTTTEKGVVLTAGYRLDF